jgi:uncharacterized membrane protein YgcG
LRQINTTPWHSVFNSSVTKLTDDEKVDCNRIGTQPVCHAKPSKCAGKRKREYKFADHVEYYYLPQYEVYYSVPRAQYVYLDGGNWVFASALPPRFGTVNVFNTYKVVINQPTPYLYYKTHKVKYAKYKGGSYKQVVIRDSREPKYYVVKGHPNYGQAKKAAPAPKASPAAKPSPAPRSSSYKSSPQPKPAKAAPSSTYRSSGGQGRGNSGGGNGGGNKGGGNGGGNRGGGNGHGKH